MILMGLGKSDEFSGERKNRFIMGLREVLQHFRNNRVRDFATIARGILDYRARFLGDKTRILPLEGLDI